MGYTKEAISGFSWQTVLKGSGLVLGMIKLMILARILTPTDFGIFSLVAIALGIAEATTETGVNYTIINSKHSVSYFLNTAWVIAIVRGFLIGLLMLIAAFGMAAFFDENRLLFLVSLASLIPVIKGFINPAIVSLRKELLFFQESTYHLARMLCEIFLAITLTLWLKDVSGLLLAMIGAALFEVIISFAFFTLKPKFEYLHSRGSIIIQNAKGLSITALLSYLHENIDNIIIGKIASPHGLGLYHNSYALTHKITHEFGKSTAHGTFPIFSKIANQSIRIQRGLLKSTASTLALSTLLAIPFIIWPEIIVMILGPQWIEAIPFIRILILGGILNSIGSMLYSYFMAVEAISLVNAHLGVSVIALVICATLLGLQFGLLGAVWGVVLARIITIPVLAWGTWKVWR